MGVRPRREITDDALATKLYPLCRQSSCLGYSADGGVRGDLALTAKQWVLLVCDPTDKNLVFKKSTILSAFNIVDAKKRKSDEEWDVEPQQAKSWAVKMTAKLHKLYRDVSQAWCKPSVPKWAQDIMDLLDTTAETEAGNASEVDEEAEEEDEEEEEEDEEEQPEDEEDEKEQPHTAVSSPSKPDSSSRHHYALEAKLEYTYGYDKAERAAYRQQIGCPRKRKELTKRFAERGAPEDALKAIWPDGHMADIAQCTVEQHYGPISDSNPKGSKLPPKTKKGEKRKKDADLQLWGGYTHDQNPARLRWRDSRGWQVSYYIKGHQKCQMKPQSYESSAEGTDINDECVSTMMALAKAVEQGKGGTRKQSCIHTEITSLPHVPNLSRANNPRRFQQSRQRPQPP